MDRLPLNRKGVVVMISLFCGGLLTGIEPAFAGVVTADTSSSQGGGQTATAGAGGNHQTLRDENAQTSLDGGQGIYFLPPLPGRPKDVRPGVDMEYQTVSPLSTKEIQWVKQQMADSQYAMHETSPLRIDNPILTVNVGPGSQVPVIRLARGYVTTLSVVDASGNPWPVTAYVVGGNDGSGSAGSGMFAIQAAGNVSLKVAATTAKSGANQESDATLPPNLMTISPRFFGAASNMVVTLKGMSTPIMLDLRTGKPAGKSVDGMVTLRIDRMGPDSPTPVMQAPPPSPVESSLLLFLSQTPPKGAVDLHASGGYGVVAWKWNGKTIVRSRIPLAMPAWTAEISQDGVRVYSLPETRQLLLRAPSGMEPVTLNEAGEEWQNPDANYLLSTPAKPTPQSPPPAPVQKSSARIVKLNLAKGNS